jgi:hypothetical protein
MEAPLNENLFPEFVPCILYQPMVSNHGRAGDSNNRPKLRGLLNRPQRERLPCLRLGF